VHFRPIRLLEFTGLTLFCISACAGNVIISNGNFSTRVFESPGPIDTDILILGSSSPFVDSQTSVIGLSTCSAQHVLAWSGDEMTYRHDTQQHLQGFEGLVQSVSSFRITPSIDSVLTIHEEYAYSHPPSLLGAADISARVRVLGSATSIYNDGDSGGTFDLEPPTGTLVVDGSIPLNANIVYTVSVAMTSHSFDPIIQSAVWAGTGFVEMNLSPIPESTALLPLALAALVLRRNPARPRCVF
jgi:hypothetical protein